MAAADFPALQGFYQLLFLYLEPTSTMLPALMAWTFPGARCFHHQLVPTANSVPTTPLETRTQMLVWQLGNCYLLLGLVSSLVFRAARDALKHDPVSQERIVGALLAALAIADVTHIVATLIGLPPALRYDFLAWNPMTHGNISFVVVLFSVRIAWFFGLGRTPYWFFAFKKTKTA
ncbi:hypothetical protein MIND_00432500 [Mycena indigotica]|uniref:DUF7704 domain-containing protein n=1 Tax=Mycena indigotica TaxID=2126181 RepID=A0A8H6SW73_9AGAR|nr:uncharacterized protein MIND_00432500 [Mycena indigotica]KAF7306413.1 hypothetical protein MIND_00432500 [Mycena indigotica]